MKNLILGVCLFLWVQDLYSQPPQAYFNFIRDAASLYKNKNYLLSAKMYSQAFNSNNGNGSVNDRYNAACSWALAHLPDSAFYHLYRVAQKGKYTNYTHILNDKDLVDLHSDKRWDSLIDIVKKNKALAEVNLNKPLAAMLDTVYENDQSFRRNLEDTIKKYGESSNKIADYWSVIDRYDSINITKVTSVLDSFGWLGPDVIGEKGNAALFFVIQHGNSEIQEKYLPMMREAVKQGKAKASNLALLEDRVALSRGEMQIYGSQIGYDNESAQYFVKPLIDPDNVDKRRSEMELPPISEYLKHWNIPWNVSEYKKKQKLMPIH